MNENTVAISFLAGIVIGIVAWRFILDPDRLTLKAKGKR